LKFGRNSVENSIQGNYQSNFYKVTPIEGGANIELRQVQILGGGSANFAPGVVQNLHPNNTNLNITNITTTTKREKNAVVAVVNFKKLKEKREGIILYKDVNNVK